MSGKIICHYVLNDEYRSDKGHTVKREYGKTPEGNALGGRWVYRNTKGVMKDFDQYREDLAQRNHIELR